MVLWLLNHFSTVGLILLIVGGTTALAVAGCLMVQRACPKLGESELEKGLRRCAVPLRSYSG